MWRFLHLWQDGRCGICGRRWSRQPHQGDHDHGTGCVRGYLCRSCNTGEAQSLRTGLVQRGYELYRERHPASILGLCFAWDASHSMTVAAAARLPGLEEYARHQAETDPNRR